MYPGAYWVIVVLRMIKFLDPNENWLLSFHNQFYLQPENWTQTHRSFVLHNPAQGVLILWAVREEAGSVKNGSLGPPMATRDDTTGWRSSTGMLSILAPSASGHECGLLRRVFSSAATWMPASLIREEVLLQTSWTGLPSHTLPTATDTVS